MPLSISRQFPAHDLEMLLVRVPALVVDGDVGDAAFDQPPRHQAGLPERVAAVAVAQLVFLLREIEHLAGVAEDQVVGLFLGLRRRPSARRRLAWHARSVFSLCSNSRRSLLPLVGDALGDDAFDGEPGLRRIAAGGEGFVARAQESGLGEPSLRLGQHDVGRNQALVAGVVALEQRDHGARRRDRPAARPASARSAPCRTPFRGR